ncbi:MAG: hypothetical protein ACR2PG_17450 [Hyphomicrobiaceae bacterium]
MKPKMRSDVALYDVFYEDGKLTSNRKVPLTEIDGLDGEKHIRTVIEAQDEMIAERSGKSRAPIKSIKRVKVKKRIAG